MPRNYYIAVGLGSLVVFLLFALPFRNWTPDDAFISFEYARNLAEGNGLVFNDGERVEGFSNLLWTLLLAAVHRVGGRHEADQHVPQLCFRGTGHQHDHGRAGSAKREQQAARSNQTEPGETREPCHASAFGT